VQVQAGELPNRFEGWEVRYRIHRLYDQAFPGLARSVAAALRSQFPGATVTVEAVAGLLASATVIAPEGTHEQQVARVREIARSVEEVVARREVGESPVVAAQEHEEARRIAFFISMVRGGGRLPPYDPIAAADDF